MFMFTTVSLICNILFYNGFAGYSPTQVLVVFYSTICNLVLGYHFMRRELIFSYVEKKNSL